MAGRRRFSEEAKDFAVLCFARFMGPQQVADAMNERFGLNLVRTDVHQYDPSRRSGERTLGKKRKEMFWDLRKRFLDGLEEIPIANKAFRLQQLNAMYERILTAPTFNMKAALDVLAQADKESGNFHSNESKVHHTGGVKVEKATDDEMRGGIAAAIALALAEERDRLRDPGPTTH